VAAIRRDRLNPNALHVVERLRRFGFEAYFVGGCVRDLLLGRSPKDFDVATSARPRQVRRFFRNCRIIGRRFKLAHVVFGDKIVETATFRRKPEGLEEGSDLLITDDNIFGTAEEDAVRRDFTINGLFYDPAAGEVIDHVGGLADLELRTIRTIGDPLIRLREDPVRILRAVKFAARLGFQIDPIMWDAMISLSAEIRRSAPPRVLEEIYRLLRGGTAREAVRLLRECGALEVVLPEIHASLDGQAGPEAGGETEAPFWRHLAGLDAHARERGEPSNALILSTLFLDIFRRAVEADRTGGHPPKDPGLLIDRLLVPLMGRLRVSRADAGSARRILVAQRRFEQTGRRRVRPQLLVRQDYFADALALLRIRASAGEVPEETVAAWDSRAAAIPAPSGPAGRFRRGDGHDHPPRGMHGRRRRRRRRRGGDREIAPDGGR
jgi:poly(A) polymerase